jgi:TonB family protein
VPKTARRSTYSTSTANCTPSGGTFAVRFNFVGQRPATDETCEREARPVQVTEPRMPSIDEDVYATVETTIGPDGQLQEAHVLQSSGNALVDKAALTFAMRAKYVPRFVTAPVRRQAGSDDESDDAVVCRPETGKYVLQIHFTPRR